MDIVVFKNAFNTVPLRNFNAVEMDLLFSIMSQMKNQGLAEVKLSFEELKKLSKYNKETAIESFVNDLERTYDKLIQLNVKIGSERKWTKFVFFTRYAVDKDAQTIDIRVNSEFSHLINELTGSFTRLELEEVTSLRSSYAKSAYRLLKQFRKTGVFHISMGDFINLMDIPDSYKIYNIRQRIFSAILKELAPLFKGLEINEHKGKGADRRNTIALTFTFEAEGEADKKCQSHFELVKKLYSEIDMDPEIFLADQVAYAKRKNPANFDAYLVQSIKGDYAKSIERQGAQMSVDGIAKEATEEELRALFRKRGEREQTDAELDALFVKKRIEK